MMSSRAVVLGFISPLHSGQIDVYKRQAVAKAARETGVARL